MSKRHGTPNPPQERDLQVFLEKRSTRLDNGCLEWDGAKSQQGYGMTTGYHQRVYQTGVLPRIVFAHYNGFLPEKPLVIRHTCGNYSCVEHTHLSVGKFVARGSRGTRTALVKFDPSKHKQKDLSGAVERAQFYYTPKSGAGCGPRKLDDDEVAFKYGLGWTMIEIAEYYDCCWQTVSNSLKRKGLRIRMGGAAHSKNATRFRVDASVVKGMYIAGAGVREIAEHFKTSTSPVYKALKKLNVPLRPNKHRPQN